MQRRLRPYLPEPAGDQRRLDGVLGEQQGVFEGIALPTGAFQQAVEVGAGQVVLQGSLPEAEHALGVLQRGQGVAGVPVQLAQFPR